MKKIIMIIVLLLSLFVFSSCQDDEELIKMTYFSVKKDEKFGVINQLGEEVIPFVYDELSPFSIDGIALAKDSDGYHLINYNNEKIVTHMEISYLAEKYLFSERTPLRPRLFEAHEEDNILLYNQKGELILTLTIEQEPVFSIVDDLFTISLANNNVYQFHMSDIRVDKIDLYEQIEYFKNGDGYLARNGNDYYFLDINFSILNEIEIENEELYKTDDYIYFYEANQPTQMSRIYVYTTKGNLIGNPQGYIDFPTVISDGEYVIYMDASQLFGVDYKTGISIVSPSYITMMMHGKGLFAGVNQNQEADFYEGLEKIFSLPNYYRVRTFTKVEDNLYIISYGEQDSLGEQGVYYVDREGNIVSGPYKEAGTFNKHGIAIITDDEQNDYLINRNFEVISEAYSNLTYEEEMDMFYAHEVYLYYVQETEDEEFYSYIFDGQGTLKHTITGRVIRYENFLIQISKVEENQTEAINMFFINDDLEIIEAKDMSYEMLSSSKLLEEYEDFLSYDFKSYMFSQFFDIMTKDKDFVYEKEIYEGYFVFSREGKFMIMTHDFNRISEELFDEVSTMPTYDPIIVLN